jgi:hypothetical protein
VKHSADWHIVTDFFLDRQITEGSCHPSPVIAQPEHGRGHGIRSDFRAVLYEYQLLIPHADYKLAGRIDWRDREGGGSRN